MSDGNHKLALITGASAGIGAAFAHAYAARGFDLALVARRRDRLEVLAARLSESYGVVALSVPADLSAPDPHVPIISALGARDVDVLINNAGFGIPRRYIDAPWTQQRDFLMTMAVAPCALAYAVLPGMAARGWGRIINVSSIAAFAPGVTGNTLYPGVKNLMVKFSQALDSEYRAAGLKITALCPGQTETEFAQEAGYKHLLGRPSRLLTQSAEQVAEIAIRRNEKGDVIVVPGWNNKIAVAAMRILPEPIVGAVINLGARKYLLKD